MRRDGFRHSTARLILWKDSRNVVLSRVSGNTSTRTSGYWRLNLIALGSRSKGKRGGLTFSMCVMPAGGLLVSPPGKMKNKVGRTTHDRHMPAATPHCGLVGRSA